MAKKHISLDELDKIDEKLHAVSAKMMKLIPELYFYRHPSFDKEKGFTPDEKITKGLEMYMIDMIEGIAKQNKEIIKQNQEIIAQNRQQAEALQKMQEAFDLILLDYFKEVRTDISNLTSFIYSLADAGADTLSVDKDKLNTELLARMAVAKESTQMVSPQAVPLASDAVQAIYEKMMPEIRAELQRLEDEIEKGLIDVMGLNTDNEIKSMDTIRGDIATLAQRLDNQASALSSQIGGVKDVTLSIRNGGGMRKGVYRN